MPTRLLSIGLTQLVAICSCILSRLIVQPICELPKDMFTLPSQCIHGTRLHPHSTAIQEGTGVYSFGPPVESIETNYIQQPPQIVPAVQPNAHINNKHDILIPGTFDSTFLPHPSLKAIGRRTTSMAAKFRCLVPKLDYWYFMLLSSLHLA